MHIDGRESALDSKKKPWTSLPKAAGFELYDWDAGFHAMFWLALSDGQAWEGLESLHLNIAKSLGGLASGGGSGSGAWQEHRPWARLSRTQSYSMLKLGRLHAKEDCQRDWARAKSLIVVQMKLAYPDAEVVEQESIGKPKGAPLFGEVLVFGDESCRHAGMQMLALDEARAIGASAGEPGKVSRMRAL